MLVKNLNEEQEHLAEEQKRSELQKLRESLESYNPLRKVIELIDYQYPGEFCNKLLFFFLCIGTLIKEPFCIRNSNYQTIIIVGDNAELRSKFIYSVLNLFPEEIVAEYHLTGISKLANKNWENIRLLYISNFDSKPNRDIIKMMKFTHSNIEYNLKRETKIIPKITTITTTNKETLLKSPKIFEDSLIIELSNNQRTWYKFDSSHFLSEETRLEKQIELEEFKKFIKGYIFALKDESNAVFEILSLATLRDQYFNFHTPYPKNFHRNFEYLIKSITLFIRQNRLHYNINIEGNIVKVFLTYPAFLWYGAKLGEHILGTKIPEMSKDQQDFLEFLIRFIGEPSFLQGFKKGEPYIDESGYFKGSLLFKAYIYYLNGSIGYDNKSKEVQNFKRTLSRYILNLSQPPYSCLELKKDLRLNYFRFKEIPCMNFFVYDIVKNELFLEYFEHLDRLISNKQ